MAKVVIPQSHPESLDVSPHFGTRRCRRCGRRHCATTRARGSRDRVPVVAHPRCGTTTPERAPRCALEIAITDLALREFRVFYAHRNLRVAVCVCVCVCAEEKVAGGVREVERVCG